MAVIYVKEQGSYVKKKDLRLSIEKNGRELAELPLKNITDLSVIGNVQVTTQVIQMLMQEGIDISYFGYSGKYIGRMSADTSKNIFLRFAQYDAYMNLDIRLHIARTIVRNKINNQISVIKNFDWKDTDYDYNSDIKQMQLNLDMLDSKNSSNEIMGVEGICSSIYFSVFSHMFKCKIRFDGRNRRPPKDPINIILSLAYTLLTKEVESSLESESFETYLGFLHGIRYGRRSLALDIVEEFRQPVVDRLVLKLFNKQMLSEFDFEEGEERINLTEDGFKKFINEYEKWMKEPVSAEEAKCFRTIIHNQTASLKAAIRNKTEYSPYAWKHSVKAIKEEEDKDVSDSL